jgi:hypothetical protein
MWEPQPLTTLRASKSCRGENFTFTFLLVLLLYTITFTFISLECMYILHFLLVRFKLEYTSVAWNSIMSTDNSKLEHIRHKFAPCFNRFFPQVHYCYSLDLEQLQLHSLHMRRHRLNALLFIHVYLSSKFWPCVLETVGLQIPAWYIRGSVLFSVCFSSKNRQSARCTLATKAVGQDADIFEPKLFFLIIFHNNFFFILKY